MKYHRLTQFVPMQGEFTSYERQSDE
jgi:hypothetical protein